MYNQVNLCQILNRTKFDINKIELQIAEVKRELEIVSGINVAYTILDPEINNGINVITYINGRVFKSNDIIESYSKVSCNCGPDQTNCECAEIEDDTTPTTTPTTTPLPRSTGLFIIHQGDYNTVNKTWRLNQKYQLQGFGAGITNINIQSIIANNLLNYTISDITLRRDADVGINTSILDLSGDITFRNFELIDDIDNNTNILNNYVVIRDVTSSDARSHKRKVTFNNSRFRIRTESSNNVGYKYFNVIARDNMALTINNSNIFIERFDAGKFELLSIGDGINDGKLNASQRYTINETQIGFKLNNNSENSLIYMGFLNNPTIKIDVPTTTVNFEGNSNSSLNIIEYENSDNIVNATFQNFNISNLTNGVVFLIDNPSNTKSKTTFSSLYTNSSTDGFIEFKNGDNVKGVNTISNFTDIGDLKLQSINNGQRGVGSNIIVDNEVVARGGRIGNIESRTGVTNITGILGAEEVFINQKITSPSVFSTEIFVTEGQGTGMVNSRMINVRENAKFGGSMSINYKIINTSYIVQNSDHYLILDFASQPAGIYTITLPTLSNFENGAVLHISRSDNNLIAITNLIATDGIFYEYNTNNVNIQNISIQILADRSSIVNSWRVPLSSQFIKLS